jgi:hypothetical protein
MRKRTACWLWLGLVVLLGSCKTTPAPLPELITLPAPESSLVPALTATALPQGIRTPGLETAQEPTSTPRPRWCQQLVEAAGTFDGVLIIAFIKDHDVWLWDENQPVRQLTDQGDVEQVLLSDDGQAVAYLRSSEENTQELWHVIPDRGEAQLTLRASQFNRMRNEPGQAGVIPFNLSWIPGTHRLAFNTYPLLPGEGTWIYVPDDLWTVDLDSLKLVNLLPKGKGGHFSFSPDGQLAAVFSPEALMLINANGTKIKQDVLEGFQAIGLGEYYSFPSLQWATDSQSLLAAIPVREDPAGSKTNLVIWKVPVDGSEPVLVKSVPAYLSQVIFSPDRSFMAYFRQPEQRSSGRELRISQLDGEEDFLYLRGDVMERFQWLPDSQRFLYWEAEAWRPMLGHICQDATDFPDFPIRSDIYWVDGNRFLFLSGGDGAWQLNLGYIDGELFPIAELGESSAFSFSLVTNE